MALVTTMVLVTTSVPSGRVSNFPWVRHMGRAVRYQPDPVGVRSARHMPNNLRKITRVTDIRTGRAGPPHQAIGATTGRPEPPLHPPTAARGAHDQEAAKVEVCLVDLKASQ